jgi:Na+/melibiose symporter-like transporter
MTQVTQAEAYESAWANANFRRLWIGSGASSLGTEIAEIAVPLLALVTLSANAAELSAVRFAQFLPFLLATLPLGLLVDRRSSARLWMMVGSDLGRFVLVAGIPISVWAGFASIELLCATIFCAATLTVLYQVADFALLPSLVPKAMLVDANGKITATQAANEIGGRGLGGLLVQAVSAPVAIVANALGFLVSALSLRRIRVPAELPGDTAAIESSGSGREIVEGLRIALGNRYIRPLLGESTTYNVFSEIFFLALMLILVRDLDFSAAAVGLVFTMGGAGSFLGAWFGPRVTRRYGYGRVLLTTLIIGNLAPVAAVLVNRVDWPLLLLCAVFLTMGIGIGIANVHGVSLRQTAVSADLRGRVNAAYRMISWGAIPVGAGLGGLIATRAGPYPALVVGAIGVACASLWVAFSAVPRLATIDIG